MYRSDWISRKIVDIIPEDMTREWRLWQSDGDDIELIEGVEEDPMISVALKMNLALKFARKDGWAYMFIGIKGADHSQELDPETVGQVTITVLR